MRTLIAIWACLLVRLLFYAAMFPMWEGVDEWAHFSVVQQVALRGELLSSRDKPISREIEASLRLAPLPWESRHFDAPSVTHDDWWQLPEAEREGRSAALRAIPIEWAREDGSGAFTNYEALHAPLYYWIMAPLLWILRGSGLGVQLLALRCFTAVLASAVVPLLYWIALKIFESKGTALGCAAVVAAMPGFAGVGARVCNDALAVTGYALMVLFGVILWRKPDRRAACGLGIALGLGLLTKAYFLTAVPAALGMILWGGRKLPWRWKVSACLLPLLIAGWWYVRNIVTTGTLAGLAESVLIQKTDPQGALRVATSVPWLQSIDAVLFSHLYCSGWSWLTVRSWMYHIFYIVLAAAAAGLWRWRVNAGIVWLAALYACFWAGELWHAALMFAARGVPVSNGWYLYSVVAVEVPLCVAGLSTWIRRWAAPLGAGLFAVLDLTAMHTVALPYYAGLIRHQPDGSLHLIHLTSLNMRMIFARLSTFMPEPVWVALWVAYLTATAAVVGFAFRSVRRNPIYSVKATAL